VLAASMSNCGEFAITGSIDNTVKVTHILSDHIRFTEDLKSKVFAASFSPSSQYIITGVSDGIAYIHILPVSK